MAMLLVSGGRTDTQRPPTLVCVGGCCVMYCRGVRHHHRVILAGHSLGGALAIVMAAALREARPEMAARIAGVVSFGAPRVGDAEFAQRFDKAFAGRAYRITHGADIIPHVRCSGSLLAVSGLITESVLESLFYPALSTSYPSLALRILDLPSICTCEHLGVLGAGGQPLSPIRRTASNWSTSLYLSLVRAKAGRMSRRNLTRTCQRTI